jgi:hypothetical protein
MSTPTKVEMNSAVAATMVSKRDIINTEKQQ